MLKAMPSNKAEKMFEEREELLAAVAPYISTSLRAALEKKVNKEKEKLSNILAPKDIKEPNVQHAAHILNPAFFERRSLDITLFE